jgi:hypothetical protein
MATILNAGTTSATALNVITDTTGAMAIQTSGTTAIAISSSQAVTLTNPLPVGSGGTGLSSLGTGVATFLGTPSSANLLAAMTDETGTGVLVFGTAPTISSANLTGTPVAPTAAAGTNTTQIATTAFVSAIIPAGTVMLFYQAAAPTGWTQVTTQNNKALRVVSGVGAGTGGSVAFTTAFASQSVTGTVGTSGATTLTTAQIPSHSHTITTSDGGAGGPNGYAAPAMNPVSTFSASTDATGSGGSHTHTGGTFTGTAINLAVQYIDVILASKN